MGLQRLLSDLQYGLEALLNRRGDASGHLRGAVPVVGTHGTAPLLTGTAGRLMAHHLIDDPAGMPASSSQVAKVCRKSWAPRRSTASSRGSRAAGSASHRCSVSSPTSATRLAATSPPRAI